MGDLSKNLSRKEFACPCGCGAETADIELVAVLQDCVDEFQSRYRKLQEVRIHLNSANRCPSYNATIKGASATSKHTLYSAVDFRLTVADKPVPDNEIASYLESEYPNTFGIGRYNGRTHLDVRRAKARWNNT